WALLGLLAAGEDGPAVERAVEYLLAAQRADGDWEDRYWTGTGFPRVFYLKYHFYARYFPLWALGLFRRRRREAPPRPRGGGGRRVNATLALEPLARLGRLGLDWAAALGRFGIFLGETLACLAIPPFKAGELVRRLWFVGYRSLSVVVLTGAFTGL